MGFATELLPIRTKTNGNGNEPAMGSQPLLQNNIKPSNEEMSERERLAKSYSIEAKKVAPSERAGTKIGLAMRNIANAEHDFGPINEQGYIIVEANDRKIVMLDISTDEGARLAGKVFKKQKLLNVNYNKVNAIQAAGEKGNEEVAYQKGKIRTKMALGGAMVAQKITDVLPNNLTDKQRTAITRMVGAADADGAFFRVEVDPEKAAHLHDHFKASDGENTTIQNLNVSRDPRLRIIISESGIVLNTGCSSLNNTSHNGDGEREVVGIGGLFKWIGTPDNNVPMIKMDEFGNEAVVVIAVNRVSDDPLYEKGLGVNKIGEEVHYTEVGEHFGSNDIIYGYIGDDGQIYYEHARVGTFGTKGLAALNQIREDDLDTTRAKPRKYKMKEFDKGDGLELLALIGQLPTGTEAEKDLRHETIQILIRMRDLNMPYDVQKTVVMSKMYEAGKQKRSIRESAANQVVEHENRYEKMIRFGKDKFREIKDRFV